MCLISIQRPHIVFLVETWLSCDIPSSVLGLTDYVIYCKDRATRGGGVLIAIRNDIRHICLENETDCELLEIDVLLSKSIKHKFLLAYNPDVSDTNYFCALKKILYEKVQNSKSFTIVGDFNFPDVDWVNVVFNNSKNYKIFESFFHRISPVKQSEIFLDFGCRGGKCNPRVGITYNVI